MFIQIKPEPSAARLFFLLGDNMGAKPFSTVDEQIMILRSRGLVVSDDVECQKILLVENYYNVINGYKIPFLKRGLDGELIKPEEYIKECNFNEIYSLHNLDRVLRHLILKYLLKFETHFKTTCAYNFSNKFKEDYSYLNISNYSTDKKVLSNILKNIAALSAEVNKNTNTNSPKSPYIGHYLKYHDSVPLWVLVNSLTIGNMSYFFSSLDDSLKDEISKVFSLQYKGEYSSCEKIEFEALNQIVKMVNHFRNICAHEEVLYHFSLDKKIQSAIFSKHFKGSISLENEISRSDLYSLILLLKLVLTKSDYLELIKSIDSIFVEFKSKFSTVMFADIILLAGFKDNWKELIMENL